MLPTDQEVAEAKSKPAFETPWLDEGPFFRWTEAGLVEAKQIGEQIIWPEAAPCRQRD